MKHKPRARPPPTTRNIPELGISAENSVRQFRTTFLGLMGSNPQLEGVLLRLLPAPGLPRSHRDRSKFSYHKRCSGRENRYAARRSERSSSEGPELWHFCSLDIYPGGEKGWLSCNR